MTQIQIIAASKMSLASLLVVLSVACTDTITAKTEAASEDLSAIQAKDLAPEPQSKIVSLQVADSEHNRKLAGGKKFMAVTANEHASNAAYAILAEGGTAIDAAVAAQMVLGLVEPQSSGLGGGGFMLYWDAAKATLETYDGRETAPLLADENLFFNPKSEIPDGFFQSVIGGKSVGVPGIVKLLEIAHAKHGRAPWPILFDSAIGLAENGFAVSERLNKLITLVPKVAERKAIADYLFADGQPLAVGHRLKNPAYAATLKQLATNGSSAFYQGALAEQMIAAINNDKNAGQLSQRDLNEYQIKQRAAVCKEVFAHKVCGMGPPSSGGSTTLAILGILEHLDQTNKTPLTAAEKFQGLASQPVIAHQLIEASRLAFADRNTYIADPDFVDVPIKALLDDEYLKSRAELIRKDQVMTAVAPGDPGRLGSDVSFIMQPSPELLSTTHMSIVDRYGNALSMTSSIETAFGSRLMVGGFILNNQLTDFSFVPRLADKTLVANRVQAGKRPRSSMSPMIVFDQSNKPVLVIGSPGGKKIIGYVARVLYEVLAFNRPLADAIEAPHVFHMGSRLELESSVDAELKDALIALGHQPIVKPQTSGLHAIILQDNQWLGVADPRREGTALGR